MSNSITDADVKQFVATLYADGKTPSEQFGLTWEMLSQLEKDAPELTCRKSCNNDELKTA